MSSNVKVTVDIDDAAIAKISRAAQKSLEMTAEQIHTDLVQSQTMPFRQGTLQNDSTFVDKSESAQGHVVLVSDTPYARRLYYHPEYHFNKEENPMAGAAWFEPYSDNGANKAQVVKWFKSFMKMNGG